VGGTEGYDCYRIPAIVRLPDGTLLIFAEGRKFNCDDHDWNDIVMKRSRDGGQTWSNLTVGLGLRIDSCRLLMQCRAPQATL
jgi:sialidase-1